MLTRILIPTDFSGRAAEALRYSAAIAERFRAEIVLLHVVEPVLHDYAMIEPTAEQAAAAGHRNVQLRLDAFADAELPDRAVTRLLAEGDPADQILCAARREKAGLIVMPTRGRSRVRQFLIGSVTAKVLHDAPVPVWTGVHLHQHANFPELRLANILCAVDFGSQANAVLHYAARLAHEFAAHLTVMHVAGGGVHDTHARLEALLAPLDTEAAIRVEAGVPHKVVATTAGQIHADVVVIGRACSTGMMGRLREQAYGIVRDSPCPVLSV